MCADADDGDHTPLTITRVPDLEDETSSDALKVHWRSEPLQRDQKVRLVSFSCKDQGYGNLKGEVFLYLDYASTGGGEEIDISRRLTKETAKHNWTDVVVEIGLSDPIRERAQPGDRYSLRYRVGGDGGHCLYVKDCAIYFGGGS